ncbi:MAG: hypothetical protein FJW39_31110 [Acidobacteria bacterium]|nr:hypothetical protein [Acidobacteriota bacterium]
MSKSAQAAAPHIVETASKPPASTSAAPQASATGNVDKIRDIIFGGQMREYEARFDRLEELVRRELSEIRESTRKRIDTLEAAIRRELEALATADRTEREQRTETLSKLTQDLRDQGESLTRKLNDTDTRHTDAERGIRNDMSVQNAQAGDELERRAQDLAASLDRRFRELNHSKTDRAALAAMLTEVAMRLKGDFELPSGE